ncbi:MAG: putative toxin-antitoxin system toxin component, PIN family [Betaproteobacteria bacterium]
MARQAALPRLVLDTNVALAGLLWGGPPRRLLQAAGAGAIELAASQELLDELARVLAYPKFAKRMASGGAAPTAWLQSYAALVEMTPAAAISPTVAGDPDDDRVLACALAARADIVVSGDAHLLNFKHFHGIPIMTPREAVARVVR